MNLRIVPYTLEHAKIISTWNYEPPYDVYNFPTYEYMETHNSSFLDIESMTYHSIINDNNELIAVCNLSEEEDQVFFGISINPIYCWKGLSKVILPMIIKHANELYHKPLYLQVRVWNERAIKAYQNNGFTIIARALLKTETGPAVFYIMKRPS